MSFYLRDERPRHIATNNIQMLDMLKAATKRLQEQRARARYDDKHYWFKAYPSCPPSTIVHVRGGLMYADSDTGAGEGWWVDPEDGDFGPGTDSLDDGGGGGGGAPSFTNAYYYRGFILLTDGLVPGVASVGLFFYYTPDEYATAEEAQDAVWDIMFSYGPFFHDLPVAILILRNNGTTGSSGQIQEIDAVNRGRSYLWRDVRPRYVISHTT